MAHKKGAGSTDNGRDSKPKYLGVKMYGGQTARAGNILIRQRGTRWHSGENTYLGKDHTVHAKIDGIVTFTRGKNHKSTVHVLPFPAEVAETLDVVTTKVAVVAKPVAPKVAPAVVKAAAPVAKAADAAPAPVAAVVETPAPVVVETPAPAVEVAEKVAPVVVKAVTPKAAAAVSTLPKGVKQDDLKIVEGIGPKIEGLLHEGGIKTWFELSQTPIERLKEILDAAGSRYQMHDPGTWPKQAQFAHEGRFDDLKEWQDMLDGGKSVD